MRSKEMYLLLLVKEYKLKLLHRLQNFFFHYTNLFLESIIKKGKNYVNVNIF